jgi:hypothetical protein
VGKCNGAKWWLLVPAYETQNYWGFGLCPTSGILNNYVSETGSVSVLRREGDTYSVEFLRKS